MNFGFSDFFSDISNFFNYRRVLGVDIGTTAVKITELSCEKEQIALENYGILETKKYLSHGNEAIQTSSLKIAENDAVALLKILLNEMKPRTNKAVATIPIFSVFIVPIETPLFSADETAQAISFQARQYIPIPISEVSLDWIKIDEFDGARGGRYQKILLTAVPNEILNKYKNIFIKAGLKLAAIEVESQSLVRAANYFHASISSTIIVDLGAFTSNFVVVENGIAKHIAQTDYGGISLTQALAHSFNISVSRAEELKCRRGLLGAEGEYELSTSLFPFLDVIIQECERARDFYEKNSGKKVDKLILTGGGGNLPGIGDYFSERMGGLKTEFLDISRLQYITKDFEPILKSLSGNLGSALGAAMRFYV